ncbi:MAG: guanylate kinase [Ignavibacteriae bacterium]|nr:MAG: guanylate kinase [Ignavibacteriota bacterium]
MTRGTLIAIAAPSGCGKTTIAKAILSNHPDLLFSVSATTRPKRSIEVEGKDHFFLTKEQFEEYLRLDALAEWEEIYGNYYGTLKSEINRALQQGRSMLFDIDVKGALSIRKSYPDDAVLIFIRPPSLEVLQQRLESRNTENPETLRRRMERVPMELEQGEQFDFQIVNDDLTKAIHEVEGIVQANMKKSIQSHSM